MSNCHRFDGLLTATIFSGSEADERDQRSMMFDDRWNCRSIIVEFWTRLKLERSDVSPIWICALYVPRTISRDCGAVDVRRILWGESCLLVHLLICGVSPIDRQAKHSIWSQVAHLTDWAQRRRQIVLSNTPACLWAIWAHRCGASLPYSYQFEYHQAQYLLQTLDAR